MPQAEDVDAGYGRRHARLAGIGALFEMTSPRATVGLPGLAV